MKARCWIAAYFLAVALWLVLAVVFPRSGQRSVFFCEGRYPLWDHVTFRNIVETERPYRAETDIRRPDGAMIMRQDVCYPALAMTLIRRFPNSVAGGWCFTALGALLYLGAVYAFLRRYGGGSVMVKTAMMACSLPFIFSVHIGNMILYAVAASVAFLTWYDSESRSERVFAAACLAFAAVLKISPVLLGLLYLGADRRRHLGMALLSGCLFGAMLLLPFAFNGGVGAFSDWLENARLNAKVYTTFNGFGVYGMVNAVLYAVGYRHEVPDWVFTLARSGSVVLALLCLARSFRFRGEAVERMLLVVLGMLFLPPTMMSYCSLYVLPVILAIMFSPGQRLSDRAALAFLTLSVPLQVPLLLGSVNACFSTVALIDLSLLLLSRRGDTISAGTTEPSPA